VLNACPIASDIADGTVFLMANKRFLAALAVGFLVPGLILWRLTPANVFLFFIEDFDIFWTQQYLDGFWHSAFRPYSGYVTLIERIGAALAAELVPVRWQPVAFGSWGLIIAGWTAATIAASHKEIAKGCCYALLLALVPHAGEVWANLTNTLWFAGMALPFILWGRCPTSVWAWANQLLFTALAGLSGPFAVLLAPVWAIRGITAFRAGDRYGLAIVGVLAACAVVQAATSIAVGGQPVSSVSLPILITLVIRLLGGCVWPTPNVFAAVVSLGVIALILSMPRERALKLSLFYFGLVIFTTAALTRAHNFPPEALAVIKTYSDRYFYAFTVAFMVGAMSVFLDADTRLQTLVAGLALFGCLYSAVGRPIAARIWDGTHWASIADRIGTQDVVFTLWDGSQVTIPRRPR
jgi:hypothetical protein